jgi:hypothetical protein
MSAEVIELSRSSRPDSELSLIFDGVTALLASLEAVTAW